MTEKPLSYMERMRRIHGSLAAVVPQAAHRARVYALEDNGAADLAHRKRDLRESIATRHAIIFQIEQRQAGADTRPPLPAETAERYLAGHREAIVRLKEKLATIAPAAPLIAPMTRRVAREDRRRARKAKADKRDIMTKAHLLTGAPLQELYRQLAATHEHLSGHKSADPRPPWLFEILLQAYPDHDANTLKARIEDLLTAHGQDILRVIEEHSPGGSDYIASLDRLYACPEVLLVADLARHYPARLRAVAGPSDFASALNAMADELNGK